MVLSIRRTIHLLIILPLISVMGLTSALIFIAGREIVNNVAEELSNEVSEHIVEHSQNYLDTPHMVLQQISIAEQSGVVDFNNFTGLEKYMWQLVKQNEAIDYVFYGDEQGRFLGVQQSNRNDNLYLKVEDGTTDGERQTYSLNDRGKRQKLLLSSQYDPRSRPWYRTAKQVQKPTWSEIYPASSSSVLSISPILPIYEQPNKLQGVLSIQMSLNEIGNFLAEIKQDRSMEAFILDRQGNIVATSAEESLSIVTETGNTRLKAINSTQPLIKATAKQTLKQFQALEKIRDRTFFTFDFANKRQLVQIVPLKNRHNLDWLVAVVIPEANFMSPVYRYVRLIVIVGTAIAILAIFTALKMSGWIVEPIGIFDRAAKDIEQQNFQPASLDAVAQRQDEFGQLGRVFQLMATVVYQRESSLQQQVAKLRAEQEQTNEAALVAHFRLDRWQKLIAQAQQLRQKATISQSNELGLLHRVPLLQNIDLQDLADLWQHSDHLNLAAGENVYQIAQSANCFYIILSGAVEAVFPGVSQPLTSFSFGDLVGELSCLAETPRLMNIRTIAATELIGIDRQQLTSLSSKYSQIADYLERNFLQHRLDIGQLNALLRQHPDLDYEIKSDSSWIRNHLQADSKPLAVNG
ncbi:MAG: cache domain-containing protein [Cyanobacteria bacterium P01_A01_bin.40]